MFGNLEGAVRRGRGGRGGKEKEWTDCVQSDIRAFGITGDWATMALKAEVWVETVTEGGRRFMAAWREEEEDAARHPPGEQRGNETGKVAIAHGSVGQEKPQKENRANSEIESQTKYTINI